jgi:hypothetical protein
MGSQEKCDAAQAIDELKSGMKYVVSRRADHYKHIEYSEIIGINQRRMLQKKERADGLAEVLHNKLGASRPV